MMMMMTRSFGCAPESSEKTVKRRSIKTTTLQNSGYP